MRPRSATTASRAGGGGLWARFGLRARITVLFGLGALLLSVSMGGLSYFTARHFLVRSGRTPRPPGLRPRS